jgi:hypothetical protein
VRQFAIGEQARDARVVHGKAIAAGVLRQRATEP